MKIIVVGTRGFPNVLGGVEKHCEQLYPRLVDLGNEVIVFTRKAYIPNELRLDEWKGVKFKHLWCPRIKSFEAIIHSSLAVIIARFYSPDILHIHAIGPAIVSPIARILRMKIVVTHHGPDYQREKWGKLAKIILKVGEYFGIKYSNKLIVISKVIQNHVLRKHKNKETILISNGINNPELISPDGILSEYGLKKNEYIFSACRFVPEKGLHHLIEVFSELNLNGVKLVIAGDADHETEYSKSIKESARKKGVILTGNLFGIRLAELFTNAGLFVLPSYYEGLPIALLEAISFSLPVLVSDIPQHKEINLSNNRYFKTGDEKDLKIKIEELFPLGISEEEKLQYKKLIFEKYNWDKIAEITNRVYQSVSKPIR
jgi:glycosyltransferase involved in cell wall biosynthesis